MNIKNKFAIFFLIFFLSFFQKVEAAVLYFAPEMSSVGMGREFYVDYKVNTESDFINATQATIKFPTDKLEVVGVDKQNSVFSFWLQDPVFSNDDGEISFIGGSGKGLQGNSMQIVRIRFKTVGLGTASLETTDPVVTANDGKGTNILRTVENSNITVSVSSGVRQPTTTTTTTAPATEVPQRVERVAVPASNLPQKPKIRVPLYPDEGIWYGHQGSTSIFWDVPNDVTNVAISVDSNPNSTPAKPEKELFTGKNIGFLNEGVNYIHIQFKNSKGWGAVAHYRIAIDLSAPQSFDVQMDSVNSDNPTPKVSYIGLDALSGFDRTLITVDDQTPVISTSSPFTLKPQYPGKHTVIVKVFDKAGNSFSASLDFNVIPLPTPTISFITSSIASGEKGFAYGTSTPNTILDYKVLKGKLEVVSSSVDIDPFGKWEVSLAEGLDQGNYSLTFSARDDRGAVSYPTETLSFKIRAKTVLSLGFVDFTLVQLIIIGVLLIISGVSFASWYYITDKEKRYAYRVVASRDVDNLSNLISGHIKDLSALFGKEKTLPNEFKIMSEMILGKMSNDVEKIKKYIGRHIR